MNDYALTLFFLKNGKSIHDAVKLACQYIDWFSYEVKEAKKQ